MFATNDALFAASLPPALPIGPMTPQWLSDSSVSQDLKDQWIKNGFSILRGAYAPKQIAA
ncbi:hypothetical protein [Bradyrhizobium sp. Ai1a-2]|uniref:hypothetical protein n=1 Tax=Bradyrhizobium sp. Ai1a-2 TaxID=196490 RepID=UPI000488C340|nr:hypothetical protein [Bradyrhizobium sp. Ai1a-2]